VRRFGIFFAAAAIAAGCGGHPAPVDKPADGKTVATHHDVDGASHAAKHPTSATSTTLAPLPDVGCPMPTCVYHVGGGAYFTCLAGGAGACFHFGGPCTPADSCMYDPTDHHYKTCATASEGVCAKWAASCTPAHACMFDPVDGLQHHCDSVSDGTCQRFGALCAP